MSDKVKALSQEDIAKTKLPIMDVLNAKQTPRKGAGPKKATKKSDGPKNVAEKQAKAKKGYDKRAAALRSGTKEAGMVGNEAAVRSKVAVYEVSEKNPSIEYIVANMGKPRIRRMWRENETAPLTNAEAVANFNAAFGLDLGEDEIVARRIATVNR